MNVNDPRIQHPSSLPEIAYRYLREEILSRRLDFGVSLRQEQIADDLKMSRLPVREALMRLEVEGLIVLRPRRGYIVSSLDRDDIEEIFDTRAILEERAGFLATKKRTASDIAEVSALMLSIEQIAQKTPVDTTAYGIQNEAFHHRLFVTSGRKLLCKTLTMLRDNVERYVRISVSMAPNLDDAIADHRAIFAAFAEGDADKTARLCRAHCERTCAQLLANLNEYVKSPAEMSGA
jgi:DNA-binding GntR family transcriptional regulator